MVSQAVAMAIPHDALMQGQKRSRDITHAQQWQPGHTRAQSNTWDHYQHQAGFQPLKKLKAGAAIPPNFGASIGWTSGPPMMDLLTQQRQPEVRPGTSHGQSAWAYQPPTVPIQNSLGSQYIPAHQATDAGRSHRRHQSVPSFPTYTHAQNILGSIPEQGPDELDAYHNLDDPTYFYNEFEQVDDRLSLGEIVWTAPQPAYLALPSTYEIAEGLARYPPPVPTRNAKQTISKYVTYDQTSLQAVCASIKQSADWESMKDDPVFCDLSSVLHSSGGRRPSIVDRLRPRKALKPSSGARGSSAEDLFIIRTIQDAVISSLNRGYTEDMDKELSSEGHGLGDAPMVEVKASIEAPPTPSNQPRKSSHKRALSFNPEAHTFKKRHLHAHSASLHIQPAFDFRPTTDLKPAIKGQHNRARSQSPKRNVAFSLIDEEADDTVQIHGGQAKHTPRPRSMSPQRQPVVPEPQTFAVDAAQEDILAKLGVTGTAQKVYATPGPALNPNVGSASTCPSPELRAPQVSGPSGPLHMQARARHTLQPLQEMSPNSVPQTGQNWSGRKRGRAQSEDFDNNFKRAREFGVMHSAGGMGLGRR